jgi:hypothetical protein
MNSGHVAQPITNVLLRWILSKRRLEAERDPASGRFLLPYSGVYHWAVRAAALLFATFMVMATIALWGDTRALILTDGIFAGFLLMAGYAWYEASLVSMSFSEEAIFVESRFGGKRTIPWSAVVDVSYSDSSNTFTFCTNVAGKIRVSSYRDGLGTFAHLAVRELASMPSKSAMTLLRDVAVSKS